MPNIREYDATAEITPSDRGIQAAELAGRRIGLYGHELAENARQIGDAVNQHMAVMETSELYKTGTELRINLQQRYDEESAKPENRNDPHFGDRFMSEVGPLIDQWGSGAGTDHGKMLAATLKSNIRNDIFNHVAAGQSEMDIAHVEDNLTGTMNSLGAGLITDPSEANLDKTIGTAKDAVQGATMNIPDVAARERTATAYQQRYIPELVLQRYNGVAQSIKNQVAATGDETSSAAAAQLDKDIAGQVGFQYLSPEQQSHVTELKDEAVRQGKELFNAKDATQRRQASDDFDAAALQIETSMFTTNPTGGVTVSVTPDTLAAIQKLAAMPGAKLHPERVEALLNAAHTATQDTITGKEKVTDRGTYANLTGMIGSTTNPLTTTEVDKAYAAGQLSDPDYHFLRTSAVDSKQASPKSVHAFTDLHRWLEQVKPMIDKSDPLAGSIDQQGTEKFSYFAWDTEQALRKAIASGEEPEAALTRLTDPRNPRGFYHFIPQYQTTNKQGLAGVLQMTRPGGVQPQAPVPGGVRHDIPPAKPGESPSDYLKRTNQ